MKEDLQRSFLFYFIKRYTDKEYGAPITIGDNCWLGGNVTVLPGLK